MNVSSFVARLLGYADVSEIGGLRPSFGAPWAHQNPALVVLACLAVLVLTLLFYGRCQPLKSAGSRWVLAALRGSLLCLLVLILTDPSLEVTLVRTPKPVLWLLMDGTDSMSLPESGSEASAGPTRAEAVRTSLESENSAWLKSLDDGFRLQVFEFVGGDGVQTLSAPDRDGSAAETPGEWLERWTTSADVSALGDAFADLSRRHGSSHLAGVLVVSDFDQNAGTPALAAAKQIGAPVFPVGVGPLSAVDLSCDLLAPPTMKKAESSTILVTVRKRELERPAVTVRVFAELAGMSPTGSSPERIPVGEQTVTMALDAQTLEFPFTPEQAGVFVFTAEVDPVGDEPVTQNNRATRDVRIIDDFLRLLYVEYEPTWEWRFIKEVFHRDRLVGTRGFRTFLRSADPAVRESNELFLPGLTLPRSQFFETDVLFLGDMPASSLSTRFCEMTREFVSQFGGGLVVLAGPRFGPGELAETPLAEMLPVVVDPEARLRDEQEFAPRVTPLAGQYDFMRLGSGGAMLDGWKNLGKLPWYQPVARVESRSTTVLLEHPTEFCADGKTPQPLVAIRKYGRGEVVYIAFNELWRLRRLRGEEYYRQFWGQLIHRLGLSHAIGTQKRFVVRTDRMEYRAGEQVLLTVEAYDKDFQPLDEAALPDHRLDAELIRPEPDETGRRNQLLAVRQLKPGVFETRLAVTAGGEYEIRVTDPIGEETSSVRFRVATVSAERRNPLRNSALQRSLAVETGGKAYELKELGQFLEDFRPPRIEETQVQVIPIWSTWLTFAIVVGLMLTEWLWRKWVNLA